MKTELEEAAERYAERKSSSSVFQEAHKKDFIAGANFQAEKMYSEEEVDKLLDTLLHNNMCSVAGDELIKQFKKK
jgi:hypothetical protein